MPRIEVKCTKCHSSLDEADTKIFAGDIHVYVDRCTCEDDDINNLKNQISDLQNDLDDSENTVDDLESKVEKLETTIDELDIKVKELQDQLDASKK